MSIRLLYVIEELRLVVERKFPTRKNFLENFFMELPFELVYTSKLQNMENVPQIRDAKDSPILITAVMEVVDVLLTEDKDFLVLDMEVPEIMTMTEFLEKY